MLLHSWNVLQKINQGSHIDFSYYWSILQPFSHKNFNDFSQVNSFKSVLSLYATATLWKKIIKVLIVNVM